MSPIDHDSGYSLSGLSYYIARSVDPDDLARRVTHLRAQGWRLHGRLLAYAVRMEGITTAENHLDTATDATIEFAQALERDL